MTFSLILLTGVLFFQGLFSTFIFRQLENDGTRWALALFNNQFFVHDPPQFRYVGFVIQIAPLLAGFVTDNLKSLTWLFCFCCFLFPFVGLSLTYFINRTEHHAFLLFSLLGFCLLPNWSFSVSGINEVVVISVFLMLFSQREEKTSRAAYFLFSIISLFTYELMVLVHFVLLVFYIRERKHRSFQFKVSVVSLLLIACNLLFVLFPRHAQTYFLGSLKNFQYSWAFVHFIVLVMMLLIRRWMKARVFFYAGVCIFVGLLKYEWSAVLTSGFEDRIWAIPAAIFLLGYFIRKKCLGWEEKFLILALVILNLINEGRADLSERRFIKTLTKQLERNEKCIVLNDAELFELRKNHGGDMSFLPIYSILMAPSRHVEKIVIAESELVDKKTCNNTHDTFFLRKENRLMSFTHQGKLDFSAFKNEKPPN